MNNEEILKKVDEIINYIESSSNYKKYLLLKEKMKDNKEINDLLEEIKNLNKMIANNHKDKNKLEEAINKRNELLMNKPLYREYINTIDEINNTFNIIETSINKYLNEKIN